MSIDKNDIYSGRPIPILTDTDADTLIYRSRYRYFTNKNLVTVRASTISANNEHSLEQNHLKSKLFVEAGQSKIYFWVV